MNPQVLHLFLIGFTLIQDRPLWEYLYNFLFNEVCSGQEGSLDHWKDVILFFARPVHREWYKSTLHLITQVIRAKREKWGWTEEGLKDFVKVKLKLHTYIAPLEVHGHLICGMLYITSLAGLLHPTLVWRFQEATNIPMQGGAWPVYPLMPEHYQYSFTPEWGEALSIWSKGVLNPSYLSFNSGQSRTRNLSHRSQELYGLRLSKTRISHILWDI